MVILVPTYDGVKPTKAADETYTYEFADWDKELVAVTGNVTYKATYTSKYIDYTVKFVAEGATISEKTYHYGDTVEKPAAPTPEEIKSIALDSKKILAGFVPDEGLVQNGNIQTAGNDSG